MCSALNLSFLPPAFLPIPSSGCHHSQVRASCGCSRAHSRHSTCFLPCHIRHVSFFCHSWQCRKRHVCCATCVCPVLCTAFCDAACTASCAAGTDCAKRNLAEGALCDLIVFTHHHQRNSPRNSPRVCWFALLTGAHTSA